MAQTVSAEQKLGRREGEKGRGKCDNLPSSRRTHERRELSGTDLCADDSISTSDTETEAKLQYSRIRKRDPEVVVLRQEPGRCR